MCQHAMYQLSSCVDLCLQDNWEDEDEEEEEKKDTEKQEERTAVTSQPPKKNKKYLARKIEEKEAGCILGMSWLAREYSNLDIYTALSFIVIELEDFLLHTICLMKYHTGIRVNYDRSQ